MSLLEVVTVLTIMATIAAVTAPRYANSLRLYRLDAAANRIATDLEHARRTARSSGTAVMIGFDTFGDRYGMTGTPDLDDPNAIYFVDIDEEPYNCDISFVSVGTDGFLVFDAYGLPDSSASITVASGGLWNIVLVDSASGEVTVH